MVISVHFFLMVLAVVLLALAAAGVAHPRWNLMALGLAVWALATIVTVEAALLAGRLLPPRVGRENTHAND